VRLRYRADPRAPRGLRAPRRPSGKIGKETRESAVYTRFDAPWVLPRILPPNTRIETARGIRIVTPAAMAMRVPVLKGMLRRAEWLLCDSRASVLGGFYVAVIRKG